MTKPFIKPIITPEEAADKVREGTTIMLGGFNYGGVPTQSSTRCTTWVPGISGSYALTQPLQPKGTAACRSCQLIVNRQVSSMVIAHMGLNAAAQDMFAKGEIDIELNPWGPCRKDKGRRSRLGGFLTRRGGHGIRKNRQTWSSTEEIHT
jgi:acetate CoA/acetoacetate CoA-transferase alpha subunit